MRGDALWIKSDDRREAFSGLHGSGPRTHREALLVQPSCPPSPPSPLRSGDTAGTEGGSTDQGLSRDAPVATAPGHRFVREPV